MTDLPDRNDAVEALPCGRDPVQVVDDARAGRLDEHERGCPHCRAVARADAPAERAVLELASSAYDPPAPASLLPGVMSAVWSELRRTDLVPLRTTGAGATIATSAIGQLLERDLRAVSDVRVLDCDVESGAAMSVSLHLSVRFGIDWEPTVADVRARVQRTLRVHLADIAERIDVAVDDVHLDDSSDGGPGR